MDLKTQRIANGRQAIERAGGVGQVAQKMGYSNPSFLVQMFGPNPTRAPSEKTMRRMEGALGLADRSLDRMETAQALPPAADTKVNVAQLSQMIQLVNKIVEEEKMHLSADRFSTLVAFAYEEASEHNGVPRESKLRQVVQLLK